MSENKDKWLSPDGLDVLLSQLREKLDILYINPHIVNNKIELSILAANQYTDKKINEFNQKLGGVEFGIDGDGNYGYYGADGSLIPFKLNLKNVNILIKTEKHSNENPVKYTTDKKIICVFASPGATSSGVGISSVGDKNYIHNAHTTFSITEVTDYSYTIKNNSYNSYINVIILTEK